MLLLHTTAMCDTPEEAERVLAPLRACPIADRAIAHETGLTTVEQENEAQAAQNPEGHRYAVDCTWTDARAAELAPLLRGAVVRAAHRALVLDLVRLGAEPATAGHGVLDRGARLHRDVRDLDRTRPTTSATAPGWSTTPRRLAELGKGVYLGDTDFTRRADRFLTDANFRRLEEIRARRDPDGRFCSYLIADGAELNAEPAGDAVSRGRHHVTAGSGRRRRRSSAR